MGVKDRPVHFVVENIAYEQFKFGTQMEECH